MKVTRRNVFETNSSSTHSITIVGGELEPRPRIISHDGICRIHPGEFGWEEATYRDWETKAAYALTWAKQTEDDKALAMLKEVIEHEIGTEVEFISDGDKYHPWGYIDHQSCETDDDGTWEGDGAKAFESAKTLRNFIFHPDSVLVIDNDNH